MTDKGFELTRRRVLLGAGALGATAAGAGLGTSAYFNDTESFDGNNLQAGELDLYVHYDFTVDQGQASGNFSGPKSGTVQGDEDQNTGAAVSYELADVKPGDEGSLEFCFSLVDNPAYLWMSGALSAEDEGAVTEPESDTPWERGGAELATYTRAALYYTGETSDSANGDVLITEGSLLGVLADLDAGMALHGDGDPTGGVVERATYDGGSSTDSQTDPTCVRLDWWVPTWVGNEIQGDSLAFDLSFYAEQARNNDGSGSWTVVGTGEDLQTAIDDASAGDTLLLAAGTHSGAATLDKQVDVRGEGPTNTVYDGPGSGHGLDVETAGVRVGDFTGTNWGQAVSVNGQNTSSGRTSDVMLSNIVADGNTDRALVVDYTDNAIVRDVESTNNGNDGLTLWYSNGGHVESVVANDNDDNGIYVNGDNTVILDATAKRNSDEGVDVNWYDDLGPSKQRVALDNVVAMDNDEDDVELHDNGTDQSAADSSMLLRGVETGGAPTGLRLVQVAASEVETRFCSFPNGTLDGNDNDVDP